MSPSSSPHTATYHPVTLTVDFLCRLPPGRYGTCETETEVAFFLVMAWEGCFCMTFSNDDTAATLWAGGWHYATQLGRPTGPAVLVKDNTWVRRFGGGTQARYDLRTSTGKVLWASTSPNKGESATAQATAIL